MNVQEISTVMSRRSGKMTSGPIFQVKCGVYEQNELVKMNRGICVILEQFNRYTLLR